MVGIISSMVWDNEGLCGPVPGDLALDLYRDPYYDMDYDEEGPLGGTNLNNACPPTAASSSLPCCERLRQNPIFCCVEARNPELALSACQECGTNK
jgi:hypothetical protein